MKDTNRYEEIQNLLNIRNSDMYGSSLEPITVTLSSKEDKQRYLELNDIPFNRHESFPDSFKAITIKNIVITAEKPFIIKERKNPIAYHIDTMTFETGGQIKCYASVIMTVETLTKQ